MYIWTAGHTLHGGLLAQTYIIALHLHYIDFVCVCECGNYLIALDCEFDLDAPICDLRWLLRLNWLYLSDLFLLVITVEPIWGSYFRLWEIRNCMPSSPSVSFDLDAPIWDLRWLLRLNWLYLSDPSLLVITVGPICWYKLFSIGCWFAARMKLWWFGWDWKELCIAASLV